LAPKCHFPSTVTTTTTTTTTTNSITMAFPTTTLTPIITNQTCPLHASLRVTQTELNDNMSSLHLNLGDGRHGHLSLTIPSIKYLALTNNVPFVVPANPLPQPIHPAGATESQITKINRQHLEQKQDFKTYHTVDQAL
jgi:hypothetical protein